jgi:hypothetical protein
MTHEEVQDLLEAYVDETLDRKTRAEIDRHLAGCADCRAVLDGVPAVALGQLATAPFDERAMRRAVRTTLLRLAVNVVVIGLAAWLALTLIGYLVIQPLVVDRGGRAAAATQATQDLAVMYNPGAALGDGRHDSGIITRTSRATVVWPVGTITSELGTLETRIGPFGFGSTTGSQVDPSLGGDSAAGNAQQLAEIGSGTVATVELHFDPPLTPARAQQLADSPADVRVVWAGFATSDGAPAGIGLQPGGTVGYGTCDPRQSDPELLGAASAGFSTSAFTQPSSIERALDATISAIDNLLDHGDLIEALGPSVTRSSVAAARDRLAADPVVETLVATGPSSELLRFVDEAGAASVAVRGIEFTNWFQPLCGR